MTDQNQLLRELLAEIRANFVIDGYVTSAQMDKIAAALSDPAQPVPAQPQGAGEAHHWIVPDFGFLFPDREAAKRYLSNIGSKAEPTACYTTPPASQQDLQAINTLEQERQKAWQLGYSAGQKASQQAAQAVPEGWQLVPVEPTSEMISAALRDCGGIGGGSCGEHTGVDGSDFADVWGTMLRAAKGGQ